MRTKFFKDIGQQQDISFQIQIAVLIERLDRESLPDIDNVRIIILGYGIICQRTVKRFTRWFPPTFQRSQCTRMERYPFVSVD